MIRYEDSLETIRHYSLEGFCVGWKNPPEPETLLGVLEGSDYFIAAVDDSKGDVIGFITAITDHVLTVYIPLLEVLPAYQKRGVGTELMKRLLDRFHDFYKIDLCCDEELQGYYRRFGMKRIHAMTLVNYERQSGRKEFRGPAS